SPHLDEENIRELIVSILWSHQDIPLTHLNTVSGLTCVREEEWSRDQRWDNVFSFYDPEDGQVKIRQDRFGDYKNLEVAFLIAVGQSLLGNYAAEKTVESISHEDFIPGRIFHLILTKKTSRICYFTDAELQSFLILARMIPKSGSHFTRLINGIEGFTPPGLLMGIIYAWYLDNRLASHIEYKMSVLKIRQTDLIPEQMKTRDRRESLISFFREIVFRKGSTLM
ncbi:MAG: YvcK family protein, partial [Deltaproteobacteria bacterium]|nr:YvcK family protein [Deltaproteobacteria bacterium]